MEQICKTNNKTSPGDSGELGETVKQVKQVNQVKQAKQAKQMNQVNYVKQVIVLTCDASNHKIALLRIRKLKLH